MPTAQAGFKHASPSGETTSDLLVRVGPTFLVDVGLKSRTPAWPPDLAEKKVHALVDTGAGTDGIDERLAQRLGLPEVDRVELSGSAGRHTARVYMARVFIPPLKRLLFQRFTGVLLEEGQQTHHIILGRGFLRQYRMIYDGITGQVEITSDPE